MSMMLRSRPNVQQALLQFVIVMHPRLAAGRHPVFYNRPE